MEDVVGPERGPPVLDPAGGANQARVAAYNERLILSLIHRHGELAKSEIARRSGLSAQTVSIIIRRMEEEALLLRGDPVRGKVGQPSIPMRINPDGAYSFGLKIGRRTADLLLMDISGAQRGLSTIAYDRPDPETIFDFAVSGAVALSAHLEHPKRVSGIGVAMPFELWNWAEHLGGDRAALAVWKDLDFGAMLEARLGLPTFVANDGTAACGAELVFGCGAAYPDYIYFFIGAFIGGGVVLNHALYPGRTGNAGALGSMQVGGGQLISRASIFVLERMLKEAGQDPRDLWRNPENWDCYDPTLGVWIDGVANSLAIAILSAASVIDISAAVIDGGFPEDVRDRIVEATKAAMAQLDQQGLTAPKIIAGSTGPTARATGGASLPLFARYLLDQSVLFKAVG